MYAYTVLANPRYIIDTFQRLLNLKACKPWAHTPGPTKISLFLFAPDGPKMVPNSSKQTAILLETSACSQVNPALYANQM